MHARRPLPTELDPAIRNEVVAFLKEWLPDPAKAVYRKMIEANPDTWHHDAHFAGGVIVDYALRGNGLDERALRVRDLNAIWPELLRLAVLEEPSQS